MVRLWLCCLNSRLGPESVCVKTLYNFKSRQLVFQRVLLCYYSSTEKENICFALVCKNNKKLITQDSRRYIFPTTTIRIPALWPTGAGQPIHERKLITLSDFTLASQKKGPGMSDWC